VGFTTILLRLVGRLQCDLTIFVKNVFLWLVTQFSILKSNRKHIIYTWIVMICFIAGQLMVYTHQHIIHSADHGTHKAAQDQQTVTEKCQLCDAMHHTSMTVENHQYFIPAIATDHFYKQGKYNFISIALILSAGRSPPLS
jgi:hypothetical protein